MHHYATTVRLHHTDVAGVLFYAHQFTLMHDAYESLLEQAGLSLPGILAEGDYLLPIVHAESDFGAPVRLGQTLTIEVMVERLGTTSFTLAYTIRNAEGVTVATGKTVHVGVSRDTGVKTPLAPALRGALEALPGSHGKDQTLSR